MKKRYWIGGATAAAGGALALKLLARPQDVEWGEQRERLHHAERSRFAEVEGVRVHYQEAGDEGAPALLLIHGFCASNFVWNEALVPLAEAGFRVVAPDLVGFGFSGKPGSGEYTIEAQARILVGLLDALGIERATLVGSSYGGAVAAVCALDAASRVERLVLVGAVSNDEITRRPMLRLAATPVMGELFAPVLLDARRFMKNRLRATYAAENGYLLDSVRIAAHQRPLRAAATHRAILRTLRNWSATRIEREAARITQPTLLVWGADDRDVPLRHGRRLHELIALSRLFVFPECGHLPQEERPAEFVSLVAEFCRGAEPAVV
ncbi:MAG TPA: alpha/beta fold hydrolase [Pyrinomonadaceae bacterium]|nr:alpha/beta fold hydrolase [Pyrinomonadaceae bacterium]